MIRWLNHTADVRFELLCDRYEDLFVDFVEGLRGLLVNGKIRDAEQREISLQESGPADLLVSLGRLVLFYFNTDQFVPANFEVTSATPTHLTGWLLGEPFDPDRMIFHLEVKGVTYHDLEVRKLKGKWQARVTFDV
jgi:SHS2 domain-containing protein